MSRGEAFARVQAACDARNEGKDIFILARTDALIHGWEEALARAKEFKRIGVDAVFVEALPDQESMRRCVEEVDMPTFANSKFSFCPVLANGQANHNASHRGWHDRKHVHQGPG